MHKTLQHMPHSIHIGMPYVVHNEIQYINMRGRVVRKKTAFFASIFGLTTIKQAYIPPPPPHLQPPPHFSRRPSIFIQLVPGIRNRNDIYYIRDSIY